MCGVCGVLSVGRGRVLSVTTLEVAGDHYTVINELAFKLLYYYRIWIRDVFWLGISPAPKAGSKTHLESRCCATVSSCDCTTASLCYT